MNLHVLVVFLIFGIVFVWSSDSKNSGNRGFSKKKKNNIRFSTDIANLFLKPPVTLSSVESNPFLLQFYGIKSENQTIPVISLFVKNQSSYVAINRPSAPVTQASYGPPSQHTLESPRPQPAMSQRHFFEEIRPSTTPSLLDLILIKTKTISELKCEEYLREVVGTTAAVALSGISSNVTKVENICGNMSRLVVDGSEATIGEFPHMAALGKRYSDGEFRFICGGSLISHTWILTAALCFSVLDDGAPEVRLGIQSLSDHQSGVTIAIKRALQYPEYRPPAMYSDIALVELKNAVTFSELIRPACLYQQYNVPTAAWASGWGAAKFGGKESDKLQKVQLNFVDHLWCMTRYNYSFLVPHGIRPSMICAGDPHGGWRKDTCQGDTGGPLQIVHPNNQCLFQIIGITSFGMGCGLIDSPNIYTRVSHYLPWIESIVWPQRQ